MSYYYKWDYLPHFDNNSCTKWNIYILSLYAFCLFQHKHFIDHADGLVFLAVDNLCVYLHRANIGVSHH